MESMRQDIIPGLSDDAALRCLAKISHGYHGLLESVSKRWRDTIRSSDYSGLKAQEGWCGNWLFVQTEDLHQVQWNAYDPEADRWHPLPRIPWFDSDYRHGGYSCVTVCKRFLVIGGHYAPVDPFFFSKGFSVTDDVVQFDPFKKQWSRLANLRTPRTNFACAVIRDKVYVCGGYNSLEPSGLAHAEVYDPLEDRWEDLLPLPEPRSHCFGLSVRDRFYVISGLADHPYHCTTEVFDPVDKIWHNLDNFWPFSRLTAHMTTVEDYILSINDWETNSVETSVKVKVSDLGPWISIGPVPPILLRGHSRPLKAFTFGLVGLGTDLYVVGGKVLRWGTSSNDGQYFEVVKLDKVRVCNLTGPTLEWRETRPMRGSCGAVLGCASLEE